MWHYAKIIARHQQVYGGIMRKRPPSWIESLFSTLADLASSVLLARLISKKRRAAIAPAQFLTSTNTHR